MEKTILWKRPSGTEIETNSEKGTIEYCENVLKWERVKKAPAKTFKKAD